MHVMSYSHAYYGAGHNAGAETTLHDVMRLLREELYTTTALVSKPHKDGSGPYVIDGVMVQPHTTKLDPELWFPRVDVVLSHLECSMRAPLITKKYGIKNGQLIHNDQSYCIKAAEKADFLIYNTDWVVEKYAHLGIPGVVLHPPIEPSRYTVETTREYITIVNLSDGTENNLSYDKGPRTFYELARRFPEQKFLGVRGAYGHQLIEDLPNVTIVDHTDNILDVYRRTMILLTPSKYESYGRAPVEAACSGIPSIVTDTPGLREAMGSDALYAPFGNYDHWAFLLDELLELYNFYSEYALNRAHSNWSRTKEEWQPVRNLIHEMGESANGPYYSRRSTGCIGDCARR